MQLVVVPYNTLLDAGTRASCGIRLEGNVVVVDEAHNLLSSLAQVRELSLSGAQVAACNEQLRQYLKRYKSRLSSINLLQLSRLSFVLRGLEAAMEDTSAQDGQLMSVPAFVSALRADNLNLTELHRHCTHSRLAYKLQGFTRSFSSSFHASQSVEEVKPTTAFLSAMMTPKHSDPADANKENESTEPAGGVAEQPAYRGNEFTQFVQLLERLSSPNASGRLLVERSPPSGKGGAAPLLKYVVLDPATQFHDIVRQCRSVILAGGTMSPASEFTEQLFLGAGASPERVLEFSCGHVVPSSNIAPLLLSTGPTGMDLTLKHGVRDRPDTVSTPRC